jgi:hypothetical protein
MLTEDFLKLNRLGAGDKIMKPVSFTGILEMFSRNLFSGRADTVRPHCTRVVRSLFTHEKRRV